MSRYLCPACWRTPAPAETLPSEPLAAETAPAEPLPSAALPADKAAAIAEPSPATADGDSAPAPRPKPRAGLHWVEDPNPPAAAAPAAPAGTAAMAKAAVAGTTAEKAGVAAAAPAPAAEAKGRKKWSAWVDSLLGEPGDEDGAGGDRRQGPLFCRCGAPLAEQSLLPGRPAVLGFAGGPEAGKGFLLLAMLHQLELESERGEEILRLSLDGLGAADEVFRELRRELFRQGRKPSAATGGSAGAGYAWRLRLSRAEPRDPSRRRDQPLPGGRAQLVGLHRGDAGSRERYQSLLNLLVLAIDGAALCADLELDPGDAWSWQGAGRQGAGELGAADLQQFSALCARLGPRCREVSLAIVVTKSDLLAQSPEWSGLAPGGGLAGAERQAAIARLLKECWRGPLLVQAEERFRRVGLFACSSLGFRPEQGELGEAGQLPRRPQPDQVLSPFHFLLEDVLPRRRA